jgi:diguanylate cyclase (GGDEF)-like protein
VSRRVLKLSAQNALVAAAYWGVAVLVRWYFFRYQMWPAPIWLSAGVSMFAAFSIGRWSWPGILIGSFLTNSISFSTPLFWSAVISTGNTIGAIVSVEMVRSRMRLQDPFSRVSDVLYFGLAAIFHGMISGAVGYSAVWMMLSEPLSIWPARWFEWTTSDTGASLLLVPLFLLLQHPTAVSRIRRHPIELLLSSAAAIGTVIFLLSGNTGLLAADAGASFLVLLPLLWVSVRFSTGVAYPMFVAVMGTVIVATLAGYGPYAGVGKGGIFVVFAQMAIGFGGSVLLLGAASEEQRTAEKALRQLNRELERRVEERTSELQESKQELERVALHDPLTGLPNRRFLEERFASSRAAALRKRDRVGFLLIDLDHFKEINDTLGHAAGDALLIATGHKLSAIVREYDVVCRMGGDEFAILLPEMGDRASIDAVCARIVQAVTDRIFFDGKRIETSPSIGVAVFPDHGDTWQEIYKAADVALYNAKRSGRCRWEWHRPDAAAASAT